eukprot:Partr_v1_DN4656_c0_g2_i1_m1263 putative Rhomboid family membrane protein
MARKTFRPYFIYAVSITNLVLLIVSLAVNQRISGTLFETNPFNPMLGPNAYTLILMGARFTPCIKADTSIANTEIQCPLGINPSGLCSIKEICNGESNQWWRFISAVFLHGGVLHLVFNVWFQFSFGATLEREFGLRIVPIYMLSGIFG